MPQLPPPAAAPQRPGEEETALAALLLADPWRLDLLRTVAGLALPQGRIGAGFVRDAAWPICGAASSGPAFAGPRRSVVEARVAEKGWRQRWPCLILAEGAG